MSYDQSRTDVLLLQGGAVKTIGSLSLIVAGVLLILTACGGDTGTQADAQTIRGYLSLVDSDGSGIAAQDRACHGTGGYSDIGAGAPVTVADEAGTVIATGSLDGGAVQTGECFFTFTIAVPDADFYRIEVSHRGEMTYSRQQMEDNGWMIFLTLGS